MLDSEAISMSGGKEFKSELLLPLLKELTGITIPRQKVAMVASRLRKRLAELGHPTSSDYSNMVRGNQEEKQIFINLLTTNETSFFRTPRIWKYFNEVYLPAFTAAHSTTLRVWSAAASTGEEACSIAISCQEYAQRHPGFCYQIFASDVDTDVLRRAEKGEFVSRTVDKLRSSNPEIAERYFQPAGEGSYRVDAKLMRHIRFAQHNLMQAPQRIEPSNIVFLRNVLIYFQPAEQTRILNHLASVMRRDTILILGESESIAALHTPFVFVEPQIYRRSS